MIYEYWLASLYKIDCNRRRQAVAAAGSAEALYRMPEKELRGLHLFSETEEALFLESRREADPEGAYEKFQRSGIGFLPITDPRYPEKLRQIYDPPFALYVKGRIPDGAKRSVAVVGARQCSEYGRSIAGKLGKVLAAHQVQVISGMAAGIDSAGHAGALSAGGTTFAVLGCGCDICYPKTSRSLYRSIPEQGGGILSELAPGVMPLPHFFPMRNRIISALSDIVVVVEARERSGSLITADCALEQGKDIYAVPGRFMEPLSMGCNRLIEQGAGILYNIETFLKNTGILEEKKKEVQKFEKLTLEKEEMMVYSVLDLHPKFLNLIIEETGLNLLTVLGVLEQLRQKHLIQETFPNYFCRML